VELRKQELREKISQGLSSLKRDEGVDGEEFLPATGTRREQPSGMKRFRLSPARDVAALFKMPAE
jgi:hypothetical protein